MGCCKTLHQDRDRDDGASLVYSLTSHLRFATFIWKENYHFVATVFVISWYDTILIN